MFFVLFSNMGVAVGWETKNHKANPQYKTKFHPGLMMDGDEKSILKQYVARKLKLKIIDHR